MSIKMNSDPNKDPILCSYVNSIYTVIYIKPAKFFELLTTRNEHGVRDMKRDINQSRVNILMNSIKENGLREMPFLDIDEDGYILEHEGRHRVAALQQLGIDNISVAIFVRDKSSRKLVRNIHQLDKQFKEKIDKIIQTYFYSE